MIVFLNGQFVPAERAVVSIFDRSFLYGDGLFETIRVYNSQPFRWEQHLARLQHGAEFLKIRMPFSPPALRDFVRELIRQNQMPEALLRINLSRGAGQRGYSIQGADQPFLVMTLHPAPQIDLNKPPRWRLITASLRVTAHDPLAQFKTCNKLVNILARVEAEDRGADEALLLNTNGEVAETASSNLFWIEGGEVFTPPLTSGILAGITRALILELCSALALPCREMTTHLERLKKSEAIFLTTSSLEVVAVDTLDGQPLPQSSMVDKLRQAYRSKVAEETGQSC